ncbi:MAG: 3-deoxy-D-manno-octulosonic acid transferase [Candidatus Gastranaerophilales bacterium]|nr:3-deoxy-D-manno-octulosonic acid transferase [Candidatus Gastranaerophilales bacterium]MCM1073989.1 3-deoxy-D-manno-octulosonic acid transferase [Bacteroides sp.]
MYQFISDLMFYVIKPIASLSMKRRGYTQDSIDRKCGFIPENGFTKDDNVIMFHGVSVGEAVALENLVKAARKEFKDSKIVVTTGTHTGQDIAKKKLGETADLITYFPADFPKCIRRFLDKVNPKTVFIAETEIWPNFAMECKKRGIKLYIINGRISDSTFKSYNALKLIFKYFLSFYTGIFTQSDDDNKKFLTLGANPETTKKMGNLKFDVKKPDGVKFNKDGARVILAGSTHQGEDKIVLDVFKRLKEKYSDLKLILAPRHLTRTDEVKGLISEYGFNFDLRSNNRDNLDGIEILQLDTLGELGKMYEHADISFIGGSFNKTGGHNPLESIVWDKPVLSGPSTHNFKDIYNIIKKAHAGFVVNSEEEFFEIADKMLSDREFYDETVASGTRVFAEQQGALDFVINVLKTNCL